MLTRAGGEKPQLRGSGMRPPLADIAGGGARASQVPGDASGIEAPRGRPSHRGLSVGLAGGGWLRVFGNPAPARRCERLSFPLPSWLFSSSTSTSLLLPGTGDTVARRFQISPQIETRLHFPAREML